MKQKQHLRRIFLFTLALLALGRGQAQQQIKLTSSKNNNYCNGTCTLLSAPDLDGNPNAVIFVTPVAVNGAILDPHPICAYYNGKQWSVMNVDNSTMPLGAQFSVQYYAAADASHFVHVVSKDNLVQTNSYIDHAGLNGNAKASFQLFQNASPNIRGGQVNKDDVKSQYDEGAGKWFLTTAKGKALDNATGYNISLSPDMSFSTMPAINSVPMTATPVTSTPIGSGAAPAATGTFAQTTRQVSGTERILMSVIGSNQGQFTGLLTGGKTEIIGFDLEVGVNSLTNGNTGQATSIRQYSPFIIRKASDDGSIQFFKAITNNEVLTKVTLDIYKMAPTGAPVLDYSIVLANASVSHFSQSFTKADLTATGRSDSIAIVFQTLSYVIGPTVTADTWNN
jgi:type VI secretion system Hcp family effector